MRRTSRARGSGTGDKTGTMQVHQFYPTAAYGDAASNQILSLQGLLRRKGYRSEIFCERLPLFYEGQTRQLAAYERFSSSENLLLLHYSMAYSPEVLSWLGRLPDRKVLVYHNITPHTYFAGIDDRYAQAARAGREQLGQMKGLAETAWGDSEFNCQELADQGWTDLGVLPIILDSRRYAVRPDRKVLRRFHDSTNILFVGRVSPNKRFEDLLLTFYYVRSRVQPDAKLLLVGSTQRMEPYLDYLRALAAQLGLAGVVFAGHVSTSELVAYYQCSRIYLSMSEHEGFGAPLVESMHLGLPIVAYRAAAVPETLGESGVLLRTKDYARVAELIGLLLEDEALCGQIIARQRDRASEFYPDKIGEQLDRLLQRVVG
jgi:glycosyltransferase involved in cell wall biosynthesis